MQVIRRLTIWSLSPSRETLRARFKTYVFARFIALLCFLCTHESATLTSLSTSSRLHHWLRLPLQVPTYKGQSYYLLLASHSFVYSKYIIT